MESLNAAAAAAAKAVWGDPDAHKEPISGAQGDVAHGEPYDAGNLEPARQEQLEHSLEGRKEGRTEASSYENTNNPESNREAAREDTYLPLSSTEGAPTSTAEYTRDSAAVPQYSRENQSMPQSTENTTSGMYDTEGRSSEQFPKATSTSTSEFRDESSANAPDFAQKSGSDRTQGLEGFDSRPQESFASRPEETSQPQETAFENTTSNSRQTNVPEPKPLGESKLAEKESNTESEKSEGTGQEYVRSSGFAADGGDFDATKPGAGREADRLLEQKGNQPDSEGSGGSHGHKDKPSLGHRIKEKLHISKD
ncbi:hypothetical protein BGZ63DRAFT_426002 [Mariannaea sp. PMI_226]|nr:hypothetical protein BGZ63DRAFT_426002 [Mariannaea sp. PMI_226]